MKTTKKTMNSFSSLFGSRYCIGGILLLAVVLRLIFFVGFIGQYGEENVYLQDALDVKDGRYFANFDYLKDREKDRKTDIIEIFKFRPLVYFPSGLLMRLFGVGDLTLSLWFIICSLSTIFLTYGVGTALYDRKTGCIAALILTFFPFDIVMATHINVDQIVSLFCLLTLFIIISCSREQNTSSRAFQLCLAGLTLGLAYLAKIVALTLIPCFLLLILFRTQKKDIIPFLLGFLLIFCLENLWYYHLTGIPLLHYKTVAAAIEKSVLVDLPMRTLISTKYVVYHVYWDVLFFLKLMLNQWHHPIHDKLFYIWGWFGLAGMVYSLYRRKYIVPFIFLYIYLFSEYGLMSVRLEEGTFHLYQVAKEPRHFILALPLLCILSAQIFKRLIEPWPKLGLMCLCILLGLSINATRYVHSRYHPSLKDLKSAGQFLAEHHADQKIYVDIFQTDLYMRLFSGDRLNDVERIGVKPRFQHNALVLVDGTRGVNFSSSELTDYYCRQVPVLCDDNLDKRKGFPIFALIKEFPFSGYYQTSPPLKVYRVLYPVDIPPDPPILNISARMLSNGKVKLDGFCMHNGEVNTSTMSLYLNGKELHSSFFFPMVMELPRQGENTIKVIATDSYGSRTVREVTIFSSPTEHADN